MTFGSRPPSRSRRPQYSSGGPPAWLIFLLGVALVFGVYYIWNGVQKFLAAEAMGLLMPANQTTVQDTATAERAQANSLVFTPIPTSTPIPECQDFVVRVEAAVVRERPTTNSAPFDTLRQGETVCVIGREGSTEWYLIDRNPRTRRIEPAYMRDDLIQAVNPTPTPSRTFTPPPTVTEAPTSTPTISPTPAPTNTPDLTVTETPTSSPSPTPTAPVQSA